MHYTFYTSNFFFHIWLEHRNIKLNMLYISFVFIFCFLYPLKTIGLFCFSTINSAKCNFNFLKLVSAIFYQIFIFFTKWQPLKNYEKCFLFHLKISFCSQDIKFFVIFSLPFCTSRYKRTNGCGIIYNVMNWLTETCRCSFWNNSKTTLYYIIKLNQIIFN